MKYFNWNVEKNAELLTERGIAFEDVVFCINHGGLLDTIEHLIEIGARTRKFLSWISMTMPIWYHLSRMKK